MRSRSYTLQSMYSMPYSKCCIRLCCLNLYSMPYSKSYLWCTMTTLFVWNQHMAFQYYATLASLKMYCTHISIVITLSIRVWRQNSLLVTRGLQCDCQAVHFPALSCSSTGSDSFYRYLMQALGSPEYCRASCNIISMGAVFFVLLSKPCYLQTDAT